MWKLHLFVNNGYRDVIRGQLKGQQHVVTRRKVEKLYHNYLTTALLFYKGYFQRLQALHGMPQIPRINSLLQLEAPGIDETQSAQTPAGAVQKSFHATLIHLGDISRWRDKARSRPDGGKATVLFYELAHDLNPRSGIAHHQLGIMKEGNHLEMVYHLYRACAIESPHPNAIPNLEAEFRRLLQSTTPGRRSGPPDPDEAFSNWFTKLHARSYKGEQFSQELEEEVLHRLEIALKKPGALPVLLKMVLINMAAYLVAKDKIQKEYSLDASNSCELILRLNVRWILILLRLLQSELEEYVKAAPPTEAQSSGGRNGTNTKASQQVNNFTETILPLARLYMAWLFIARDDIVKYQDHLGSYIFDMYRAVAQSLTMLAKEFTSQLPPSPYLLAEDVEALGMKPFDDAKLEPVCRIHHEFGQASFKPHWEDTGRPKNTPEQETLSRIYDLIACGFSLALDEHFPIGITSSSPQSSSEPITISYIEGGKALTPAPEASDPPHQMNEQAELFQGNGPEPFEEHISVQHARCDSNVEGTTKGVPRQLSTRSDSDRNHPVVNEPLETESDSSLAFRMEHMVDDLVDDDDTALGAQSKTFLNSGLGSSSYGMHSAEQAFNGLPTQSRGVSAGLDAIPHDPWDSFQGFLQSGARMRSPSTAQYGATAGLPAGSPMTMPGATRVALQPSVPGFAPGLRSHSGSDERTGLGSGRPSSDFPGSFREGLGHDRQRLGGSTDSSGSPFLSPKGNTRAYRAAAAAQSAEDKGKSVSPPTGQGWGNSSFSTAFSQNASGLPSINSPLGLPGAQYDGVSAHPGPYSNYQTYSAPINNWAQYPQPNNNLNMVSNGNVYDSSTAYGRGDVTTQDDPTYFRNAVKGASMATAMGQADAYDKNVMESALADDQPRPKR